MLQPALLTPVRRDRFARSEYSRLSLEEEAEFETS